MVAGALRLIGADKGLWWDEIYFLVITVRRPLAEIVTIFPGDTRHPLYSTAARLIILLLSKPGLPYKARRLLAPPLTDRFAQRVSS